MQSELWRLEIFFDVFFFFFAYYFGERGTVRLGFNPSLSLRVLVQGRNSRKNTVARDARLDLS